MIEPFLEFAQGPLFAGCFTVMVLGLLRTVVITVWGTAMAFKNTGDNNIPFKSLIKETLGWLVPLRHISSTRAFFSIVSFIFHIGTIIVPVFLLDHILLWRHIGLSWPGLSKLPADILTLLSIGTGLILLWNRIFHRDTRFLSTGIDYVLLISLLVIFMTGYIASRPWSPVPHETSMLIHVLSGNLILVLIPFTKLAQCMLYPLQRFASSIAWHFPARAGEDINKTLYGEETRKV